MANRTEEFSVSGEKLLERVREIIHQGNVRRVTIKNKEGVTLFEIPLTAGVVGAVLVPVWAAIGAIAALAASYTITVELVQPAEGGAPGGTSIESDRKTSTTG